MAVRVPSGEVQGKAQSDISMKPPGSVNLGFCELFPKWFGVWRGEYTLESLLEESWPVRYTAGHHAGVDEIEFIRKRPVLIYIINLETHVGRDTAQLIMALPQVDGSFIQCWLNRTEIDTQDFRLGMLISYNCCQSSYQALASPSTCHSQWPRFLSLFRHPKLDETSSMYPLEVRRASHHR